MSAKKLTPEQVDAIREAYTDPGNKRSMWHTACDLAPKFGISKVAVYHVLTGRSYAGPNMGDQGGKANSGQSDGDVAHHQQHQQDQSAELAQVVSAEAGVGTAHTPTAGTALIPCDEENKMGMMGQVADAAKYGFQTINDRALRQTRWSIECSRCHTLSMKGWAPQTNPDLMIKNMRQAGWQIGRGEPPVCADCLRREKEKRNNERAAAMKAETAFTVVETKNGGGGSVSGTTQTMVPTVVPAAPSVPTTLVPEPDFKLTRFVMRTLEQVFDEHTRLYKDGYSDERVAKECKTSAENVAHVRVGAFGELAEPPAWVSIRNDMTTLKNDITVLESALLDEVSKLIDPMKKRLQAMQDRVDRESKRGS